MTPLYLHYNSGRHVSQNGRELAPLLQRLVAHWPVPVEELVIVGHSMGGLVARSACHHAATEGQAWLRRLTKLVFLGTPHHGAPLERGGRRIDLLLGLSPYVAPFARLGKARSAGITDLRFGNLQDADWVGRDRHAQHSDDRQPTPLPPDADTFVLAATLAERPGRVHSAVIGDGLVPLASALGEHRDDALALRCRPRTGTSSPSAGTSTCCATRRCRPGCSSGWRSLGAPRWRRRRGRAAVQFSARSISAKLLAIAPRRPARRAAARSARARPRRARASAWARWRLRPPAGGCARHASAWPPSGRRWRCPARSKSIASSAASGVITSPTHSSS